MLLTKACYSKMLKDARWSERRKEIMRRDGFRCRHCGAKGKLNVHHRWYIYGRQPWQYPDRCLVTLCERCHHRVHMIKGILSIVWTVMLLIVAYLLSRTAR